VVKTGVVGKIFTEKSLFGHVARGDVVFQGDEAREHKPSETRMVRGSIARRTDFIPKRN